MSHPASGFYRKGEHEYVSVSEILQQTSHAFDIGKQIALSKWRAKEENHEQITMQAKRRGHCIHAHAEESFTGKESKNQEARLSLDEIIAMNIPGYIANLGEVLEQIKTENCIDENDYDSSLVKSIESGFPFRLERPIFSPYGWAGTPDIFLRWLGLYTGWDWKSARSFKELEEGQKPKPRPRSRYKDAALQLSAYSLANNLKRHFGEPDRPKITQGAVCVCYDWREPQIHLFDAEQLAESAMLFVERYEFYCEMNKTSFPRIFQKNPESLVEELFI